MREIVLKYAYETRPVVSSVVGSYAFPSSPRTGCMSNVCKTEAIIMRSDPSLK